MFDSFIQGSPVMEAGILEKNAGENQFQQELNRWFESRGIIANLRSHLRHLMIMALQNSQIGLKSANKSSPKAQAVSLLVAEYLFMHKCYYTLSVFTSEVSNLVNFHPDVVFECGKSFEKTKKRPKEKCFQENQVEEIFNALGMSSHEEELTKLKTRYLEESNDSSLIELFLQTIVKMSSKLVVLQNLKSHEVNGERLLSEEWSSRIVDILMGEKMASTQITALEEAIFRITESEMRKIIENERKLQIRLLAEREKRIQEYLKKHKDEILFRLIEAEKNLITRKDMINEELAGREKHLTKMVMEWRNKHEEILKLSRDFRNIENENKVLQKKLKALGEENMNLKMQRKTQNKTIDELQEEMNSLKNKLKEANDSNTTLKEKIQVLINKDNKEVFICHDNANQKTTAVYSNEILGPEKMISDFDIGPSSKLNKEAELKSKELIEQDPIPSHPGQLNFSEPSTTHLSSGVAEANKATSYFCPSEDRNVSLSSSSEEIIVSVRKRLQNLEEETDRINRNYLEYKLKCKSVESDSESSENQSVKSSPTIHDEIITKDTKFCQTNKDDPFIKIKKPKELEKKKLGIFDVMTKKSEEVSPGKPLMRAPTKRQLQHRDFFLKNRQLLQTLEKQNLKDFHTDLTDTESYSSSSGENLIEGCKIYNKKLPQKSIFSSPLRTISVHSSKTFETENEPSAESVRKVFAERSMTTIKKDIDCLALLEQARIKSPQISGRLRISESENEEIEQKEKGDDKKVETCSESIEETPDSTSEKPPGKTLVDRKNEGDDDLGQVLLKW